MPTLRLMEITRADSPFTNISTTVTRSSNARIFLFRPDIFSQLSKVAVFIKIGVNGNAVSSRFARFG